VHFELPVDVVFFPVHTQVEENVIEIPQLSPSTVGILWNYSTSDKVSYRRFTINNNIKMNYNDNNNNINTNICKADNVSSQNCVGGTCVKMLVFRWNLKVPAG